MALQAVQAATITGLTPAFNPVAASDTFPNTGKEVIHVKNANASPTVVTIVSQKLCDQGSTHSLTVTVPNGAERKIGPFPTSRFNDGSDQVTVQYSVTASVTAGVFRNT